ncbi:substrate-binding domain-containing protein [Anaerolentibacter hominis]|uniref:substrate-binding domain-containing protein n=1 Tax=Anaerolentibacter hominis TaxID=3079009 RepID=UPI0031B848BA
MKKITCFILVFMLAAMALTGCSKKDSEAGQQQMGQTQTPVQDSEDTPDNTDDKDQSGFDTTQDISVVSREDGSGTRGAFIELFGVEEKDENGEKIDRTTTEAAVTNNTSVMMTTVAGDPYAIGYISLGSLNETVKAVKIDGTEASVENIKSGTYKIARPFNIATNGNASEAAQDFISYIMSAQGQQVIADNGYIPEDNMPAFEGGKASGKVVVAGSSSVTPVMEKLKEAYEAINSNVTIEIQQSDSTTGMTSAIDGICDIGMASRELKDSELEAGLKATVIAMDGIAVIVNNENTIENLTSDQVKAIFTGETLSWSEVQ